MRNLTLILLPVVGLLTTLGCNPGQPKCDTGTSCDSTGDDDDDDDDDHTGDTGTTGFEIVELNNVGEACAFGDLTEGTFGMTSAETTFDGSSALVQVVFQDCARSCASNLAMQCSAEVVGTEVVVTGTASYQVPTTPETCTDACNVVMAQCAVELPAATYTLTYGGESSAPFDVPSTGLPPCASTL